MPPRFRHPSLPQVRLHRRGRRRRLVHQARVVERQNGEELAVGSGLHAAFPRLLYDIPIGPGHLSRGCPQRCPVDLPPAPEFCVARGSAHRLAVPGVSAVPDGASGPGGHLLLLHHHCGHARDLYLLPLRAAPQSRHRCVGRPEPGLHLRLVHPVGEQLRDQDGPVWCRGRCRRRPLSPVRLPSSGGARQPLALALSASLARLFARLQRAD
eukprot:6179094-Pleurochrysis_carterae.AAC.1